MQQEAADGDKAKAPKSADPLLSIVTSQRDRFRARCAGSHHVCVWHCHGKDALAQALPDAQGLKKPVFWYREAILITTVICQEDLLCQSGCTDILQDAP